MEIDVKRLVRIKIENKYLNHFLSSYSYKEYKEIKDSRFTDRKETIGLKVFKNYFYPILFLIFSLFLLFQLVWHEQKILNENYMITGLYFLTFGTIVVTLYQIFIKKKRLFLEVKEHSFVVNQEIEIYWSDVLITGELKTKGTFSSYYLILGLSTLEVLKIDMSFKSISVKDFIKIIHLNQRQ